jgi:hypothetical protein
MLSEWDGAAAIPGGPAAWLLRRPSRVPLPVVTRLSAGPKPRAPFVAVLTAFSSIGAGAWASLCSSATDQPARATPRRLVHIFEERCAPADFFCAGFPRRRRPASTFGMSPFTVMRGTVSTPAWVF